MLVVFSAERHGQPTMSSRAELFKSTSMGMDRRIALQASSRSGIPREPSIPEKNRSEAARKAAEISPRSPRGADRAMQQQKKQKLVKKEFSIDRSYVLLMPNLSKTIPCAYHVKSKEHHLSQQLRKQL